MATSRRFFSILLVVLVLCFFSREIVASTGTATYYTEYVPSACYGYANKGNMIAAASDAFWDNGGACGSKYSVKCVGATNKGVPHPCTGDSVVVTIVDYCPNCRGTIDLSEQAFASIADTDAGVVKVTLDRE